MQTLIERMQHLSEKIPFDFVISYNQEARNEVLALQSDLEAEGLRGWIDQRYFYTPSQNIEIQIEKAFEGARWTCVYAPDSYRFTPWCRAECEFSLAPERQVGVRRVIIFTTGAGSGAEKLGQEFATAPRFNLSKKGCFKDAVKLIKRSRAFLYQNSSTPNDLERLLILSQRAINALDGTIGKLAAVELKRNQELCAWIIDHILHTCLSRREEVQLFSLDEIGRKTKESFIALVFSDNDMVDAIPFQRVLFDHLFFHCRRGLARHLRYSLDRVIWWQLWILSHASNRFFREQMAERAGELIEEEEQAFPMYDEDAQNHFGAIDGIDWTFYLERSSFIRRYGERRENYRRKPRRRISSICEHVLLTKWQDSNAKVNRADSIRLKLPRSELMELIVRNFLMLYERFTDGGGLREIPEYAVHLGLAAPTPGVQLPSHAPPLIALEQFRYQVARTLDEITCEQLGWATYELSMSSPDECSDALAVLAQSFPQIIRTYKGYVSTAAARRADGSRIPSIDELLELTHCALPLLALLRARNFSTIPITVALWGAFRYFFVHGRGRVSTLAGYLLLNMRRCSEPEFRNEFRLALVFAPSSTPNSCGDGPAFNAAACRALSAEVRQRHFLHVIS